MIDTITVEPDVSVYKQENVTSMEPDDVCVPQEYEPEVSHFFAIIFVVVLVDVHFCVW
jgi:hypothetical protein